MPQTDTDLVARAQAGDQDAFAVLVERHQGKVYSLSLRLTGSAEDAADLSQEALFKAWRGLSSFQGESAFSTWLYRLTHNLCIDFLRRESRRRRLGDMSLDDEEYNGANLIAAPAPTPQAVLEGAELREELERGLARLSQDHRQALALRLAGLSYAEIAAFLEVEEGTVKSRIARARLSLRNFLREGGNFSGGISSEWVE